MKYLVILFCIFGFLFQPKVKVIESVAYSWAGGRAETGVGTNYTFKIVTGKSSEKLKIDQLWIGSKYFEVKPQQQLENLTITSEFDKKDTVTIQANHRMLPNENGELVESFSSKQTEPPYEYEGEALIGYKLKGKQKYIEVEKIKMEESRNYQ